MGIRLQFVDPRWGPRKWQSRKRGPGGRVECGHRAELQRGSRSVPALWKEEDYHHGGRKNVR